MSNKYLEKIAKFNPFVAWMAGGAAAGGAGGAYMAHHTTHEKGWNGKERKLSGGERIANGVGGGIAGAYLGGMIGAGIGMKRHPKAYKDYTGQTDYKKAYEDAYRRHRGYGGGSSSGAGNTYRSSRTIHDIHKDLDMPAGGFKTKKEATTHFRKMRSKHHPDRYQGPDKEAANKRMAQLNRSWDEFEKHPDGFTKLANAYLTKLAGVDMKKVVDVVKKNPIPTGLGVIMGAEGLSSTTRKKNEHGGRYHLRQVKNTLMGTATGVGAGYIAQEGLKKVMK